MNDGNRKGCHEIPSKLKLPLTAIILNGCTLFFCFPPCMMLWFLLYVYLKRSFSINNVNILMFLLYLSHVIRIRIEKKTKKRENI